MRQSRFIECNMPLILYSFRICPFVERTNILLNEKNIVCERIYVDIRNTPEWFIKLSPLGKVPVLNVNDTLIFESTVINEYLDEISSPTLHPVDPIHKAHNRSWIEWGSSLIFDAYNLTLAVDESSFIKQRVIVDSKLAILEKELQRTPFFNGTNFSIIDIAYAPLFKRFDSLERQFSVDILENYPKLKVWSNYVISRPSVQNGFVNKFDEEFFSLLKLKASYLIS